MKTCRCNCHYSCGGRGTCTKPLRECLANHFVKDCDHEFDGWEECATPEGGWIGSTVCKHCGMWSISHDMMFGP